MLPAFQFSLGHSVIPGDVVVGKYDGKHPCLTVATQANKVLVHSPHTRSEEGQSKDVKLLNINKKINCLAAGRLNPNINRDILMIGTPQTIHAHDVQENADLFFKDVHEGVNAMHFGGVDGHEVPLCVVGGDCSMQAFDSDGNEVYWNVCGDVVTALKVHHVDGTDYMYVGSEDYEVRIFKGEELLKEFQETDIPCKFAPMSNNRFAYALTNGTVGVYQNFQRVWRVKSKHKLTALTTWDINGDGVEMIICGWDNGVVEVRSSQNGEVMFKENVESHIAGLVVADYRMDGVDTLIAVTKNGDVRGWIPSSTGQGIQQQDQQGQGFGTLEKGKDDNEAYQKLTTKKNNLEAELKNIQSQVEAFQKQGQKPATGVFGKQTSQPVQGAVQGIIPTDTKLDVSLKTNRNQGTVELGLLTSNFSQIKAVAIFAEHLFEGEACILHPMPPANNVIVQIAPAKDVFTTLNIKALAGTSRESVDYHVFEQSYDMPRFAMHHAVEQNDLDSKPQGYCTFKMKERPFRIASWIEKVFILPKEMSASRYKDKTEAKFYFISLRNNEPLIIEVGGASSGIPLIIY